MAYRMQPEKTSPAKPPFSRGEKGNPSHQPATLKSRLLILGLGVVFLLFLIWAANIWWEQEEALQKMDEEIAALQEKVREAQERQEELNREIELLNNPEYIAEIARRDYFLSREGEIIFKAVE